MRVEIAAVDELRTAIDPETLPRQCVSPIDHTLCASHLDRPSALKMPGTDTAFINRVSRRCQR